MAGADSGTVEDAEGQVAADLEAMQDRLHEQEQAAQEARDRLIRTLADFDNYRKRQNALLDDTRRYANEELLTALLPVLDNFERALESQEQQPNAEAFEEGVRMIHRQLVETLSRSGLKSIDAVGQPFDPGEHEAIGKVEAREGQEPGEVAEELRKGYRLNGRVLRASMVKVTS